MTYRYQVTFGLDISPGNCEGYLRRRSVSFLLGSVGLYMLTVSSERA
jgi:hypothetical protein